MKKFALYIIILFVAGSFLSCESNDNPIVKGTSDFKASSKVLIEFFTNHTCVNCPIPGHYLDEIDSLKGVTLNDTNVIIIRVHTTVTSLNDPFYLFNTVDNLARSNYYGALLFNPYTVLNGVLLPAFNTTTWTNLIESKLKLKNQFGINIANNYDSLAGTGTLTVSVGQLSGSTVSDLTMHAVLTESDLYYEAPNGEKWHQNTMRKLFTGTDGMSINVQPGQSSDFEVPYAIPSGVIAKNCSIVVFVQSKGSKSVLGVEKIKLY
ncbi:MAG: Omp28-related outer membrane protein [Ignavibacteria bacterium]|nr:Omp28-related outer membrane protein [Ignavibacteria bacterium]